MSRQREYKVYLALYPVSLQDKAIPSQVEECRLYLLAVEKEDEARWQEAFNAFQSYATAHPEGRYIQKVHEHSAIALMNIIRQQIDRKQYEQAVTGLKEVVSDYSDTPMSSDARSLLPLT